MQCCSPWQSLDDLVCIELVNNAEWNNVSYILKNIHGKTTSCNTHLLHIWLAPWKCKEIILETTLLEVGLSSAVVVFQQNPVELMGHYFKWLFGSLMYYEALRSIWNRLERPIFLCIFWYEGKQLSTDLIIRMSVGWMTTCRWVD